MRSGALVCALVVGTVATVVAGGALTGCAPVEVTAVVDDTRDHDGTGPGDGPDGPGGDGAAPPQPATAVADRDPLGYVNPVLDDDFPDPFILVTGAGYFAFGTNGPGANVRVASSADLSSWTELGDALPQLPSWAQANSFLTWAPSVLERDGRFVLYFTARDTASGFQCVGRAVSSSAQGPYVDESGGPLVCQTDLCGSIDPSPFVDDDGAPWLVWKSDENACGHDARLWSAPLAADGLSLAFFATELLRRDQSWEEPLIEGPSMVSAQGHIFLFYSANWWESADYAVGYATCDSPAGPCTKEPGPWVSSAFGAGGQELFHDVTGQLWMAYHGWSRGIGYGAGGARTLRIDPVLVEDGVPHVVLTTTSQRL